MAWRLEELSVWLKRIELPQLELLRLTVLAAVIKTNHGEMNTNCSRSSAKKQLQSSVALAKLLAIMMVLASIGH